MMPREKHSQQNFDPISAENSAKPSGNTDHANTLMVDSLSIVLLNSNKATTDAPQSI